MSLFGQIGMYWRFARDLRGFLREPVTVEQSRQIVEQRLQNREKNLLVIVKRAIYENEKSPYLKLLRLAGCEYGDFKKLVETVGIENTLSKLAKNGIYVTIEEFKGKKEIARAGKTFTVKESDFDNPFPSRHLEVSSGGSRSAGTRTTIDFDHLAAQRAVALILILDACDALDVPHSVCLPILPGSGPTSVLLHAKAGKTPAKWFSPGDRREFKPSLKSRLGNSYIVYTGKTLGGKFPSPEYVTLDNLTPVVQWIADTVKQQGGCHMATYVSNAVRICQLAKEKGLDIAGAKFLVAGEPITEVKRKAIESAGASAFPFYVFVEAGWVGLGCLDALVEDEVHLMKDSFALIQYQREVPHAGISVDAFLFTTLLASTPKVLLNTESGDYGVVETRRCGCKFDELGLTDHIHTIRGFDKLTGAGTTFVGTDLLRIIEEILPARFGGASLDYQMVEEEDEAGHTRMSVVVSPDVGTIDEAKLIRTVLAELSKGGDWNRMMADVWSHEKMLRVKRIRPLATARGKLLPLHIQGAKQEGNK